jgi:folylpolyglutamate synthase
MPAVLINPAFRTLCRAPLVIYPPTFRIPSAFTFNAKFTTTCFLAKMEQPKEQPERTYRDAISLLDVLASNRTVVSMIQNSDRDMNQDAIPEMLDWVRKAGYTIEEFNKLKVVHVAGTKGKGSVCAIVSSILQQYSTPPEESTVPGAAIGKFKGLGKIGLYTSPHLVSVRERIRISGDPISQETFTRYFFELWDRFTDAAAAAGHPEPENPDTKPGYFRYLTIMALHVFLKEGVESAVVECGIGGEYDSTNILQKEAVTVTAITKLGIDHVGMLGSTIEKIAWHKSGIMKEGVECFTVPQVDEAMDVLYQRADQRGAILQVIGRHAGLKSGILKLALEGDFQKDNASVAISVAKSHLHLMGMDAAFETKPIPLPFIKGLDQVKWDGRCEVRQDKNIKWCIDGAHTMDSIKATAEWFAGKLGQPKGQAMLIFNQQQRDAPALAQALHFNLERLTDARHIFSHAVFCANTPYKSEVRHVNGLDDLAVQRATADAWSDIEPDTEVEVCFSIEEAIELARQASTDYEDFKVLVTGSLHLVGGLIKVLEGKPTIY